MMRAYPFACRPALRRLAAVSWIAIVTVLHVPLTFAAGYGDFVLRGSQLITTLRATGLSQLSPQQLDDLEQIVTVDAKDLGTFSPGGLPEHPGADTADHTLVAQLGGHDRLAEMVKHQQTLARESGAAQWFVDHLPYLVEGDLWLKNIEVLDLRQMFDGVAKFAGERTKESIHEGGSPTGDLNGELREAAKDDNFTQSVETIARKLGQLARYALEAKVAEAAQHALATERYLAAIPQQAMLGALPPLIGEHAAAADLSVAAAGWLWIIEASCNGEAEEEVTRRRDVYRKHIRRHEQRGDAHETLVGSLHYFPPHGGRVTSAMVSHGGKTP